LGRNIFRPYDLIIAIDHAPPNGVFIFLQCSGMGICAQEVAHKGKAKQANHNQDACNQRFDTHACTHLKTMIVRQMRLNRVPTMPTILSRLFFMLHLRGSCDKDKFYNLCTTPHAWDLWGKKSVADVLRSVVWVSLRQ